MSAIPSESPQLLSTKGSIKDNRIKVVPSKELLDFVNKHIDKVFELPQNLSKALKSAGYEVSAKVEIISDEISVKSVNLNFKNLREIYEKATSEKTQDSDCMHELFQNLTRENPESNSKNSSIENYLLLSDLHWLNSFFTELRKQQGLQCYLHQFISACQLVLPENEVISRNPVLEARCQKLREEQQNREYRKMTKNVDAVLKNYPEDTIAYQMKAINKQIIAVLQFVFSVVAGFVFGFLGVELIIGNLDFGFRLLLGIMCALIIALAEIYFLAKKLNEIDDAVTDPPKLPQAPTREQKAHKD